MSEENVETVRRLYECWTLPNLDLVPEILHPEIVWTAFDSGPDAGTRRGYTESRAYMNDWLEGFSFEAMPRRPIEDVATTVDGGLVCSIHIVGTARQSGVTTEIRYAGVFRFADDGRISEIREYATVEDALEAAGLSE